MRTRINTRHLLIAASLCLGGHVAAQCDVTNHNGGAGFYLGWNAGASQILDVKNRGNQPIDFYTNDLQRMRLYNTTTGTLPLLNGGTVNVRQNGYLAISPEPNFFAAGSYGPFSRLHLADTALAGEGINHYAQPWGYRSWMRNGITFTGNHDHAYIGQRYYSHDSTDLVIHWSDNADKQNQGPNHCRFLFTADRRTGSPRGSRSQEGLEFMRLYPLDSLEGFVGIGDFAQPGLTQPEPTERLDILNRTIRIRRLIPDYLNDTLSRMLVTDGNGRIHWRHVNTVPGIDDCKWTLSGGANNNDVWTAVGTGTSCPNYSNLVGIGTASPTAKLHVKWTGTASSSYASIFDLDGTGAGKIAGSFRTTGTGGAHIGVEGLASGALSEYYYYGNIGVSAWANANASGTGVANRGVSARASVASTNTLSSNIGVDVYTDLASGGTTTYNIGVLSITANNGTSSGNYGGYFSAQATANTTNNYGVYATVSGGTNTWAGYFAGNVQAGATYHPSDAHLKTDIAAFEVAQAQEILSALPVHSYVYDSETYPQMQLPSGNQVGLLAQEIEEVLPQLVKAATHPAAYNAEGELISEAVDFKAVNYVGLIPYLIAGYQAQNARIAELEEALSTCCANMGGSEERSSILDGAATEVTTGNERALTIQPNPFNERTTLYYTLERGGRMQLMANSADGKQLRVLQEANLEAGQFQHEWQTSELSPGIYYVTLLLDGEPIVKKAVKVQR